MVALENVSIFGIKRHERVVYILCKFAHSVISWLSLDNDRQQSYFFSNLEFPHIFLCIRVNIIYLLVEQLLRIKIIMFFNNDLKLDN